MEPPVLECCTPLFSPPLQCWFPTQPETSLSCWEPAQELDVPELNKATSQTHLRDAEAEVDDKANLTRGESARLSYDKESRGRIYQIAKKLKSEDKPTGCNDGGEVEHLTEG